MENEEKALKELYLKLTNMIKNENNELEKKYLNKLLTEVKTKIRSINYFKKCISFNVNGANLAGVIKKLFHEANAILFAGFDYYYDSREIKQLISNPNYSTSQKHINLYVNKDHIEKLKSTIDCTSNLAFFSFVQGDKERLAIHLKKTPVFLNVVPFTRDKENGITVETWYDKFHFTDDETQELFIRQYTDDRGLLFNALDKNTKIK